MMPTGSRGRAYSHATIPIENLLAGPHQDALLLGNMSVEFFQIADPVWHPGQIRVDAYVSKPHAFA